MTARALREYQTQAITKLREEFAQKHKRVIMVGPTGCGKSDILGHLIALSVAKGNRVIAIAHRRELIYQLAERLTLHGVTDIGIIMAGEKPSNAAVQVCSIQTLIRRKLPEAQLILVDEVHHAIKGSAYERIMDAYPAASFVGVTATPTRQGGQGLGDLWQALVVAATPRELESLGYLAHFKGKAFRKPEGLDEVKTVAGDYDLSGLAELYEKPKIMGDIVTAWLEHANGKRTIAFVPSIKASLELVERMKEHTTAEHLDYNAGKEDRKAIMDRVRSGETRFLSNVALVSEGVDLPELECVIIARPTKSLALYLQMCGRCTRPFPGKECAYLLDHGDTVSRFGHPYADREWTLEPTKPKKPTVGELRTCPSCFAILEGSPAVCPDCGHELRKQSKPMETDHRAVAYDIDSIPSLAKAAAKTRDPLFLDLMAEAKAKGRRPGWAIHQLKSVLGPSVPFPQALWKAHVTGVKGDWRWR